MKNTATKGISTFLKGMFFFVFLFNLNLNAQNLVPNPSFELHTGCGPQLTDVDYWYDPNEHSSDYMNSCFGFPNGYSVPGNMYGFQYTMTGDAYAFFGTIINFSPSPDSREYIASPLLDTLLFGKKYCVQFYVSLADESQYAIDNIGAYLSVDSIWQPGVPILHFIPQIINTAGSIITDTANWVIISGEFIAQGGEKYITIGTFFPDDSINYVDVGGIDLCEAGYYIDDVSVSLCEDTIIPPSENSVTIPNAFTPNNDSYNDNFSIHGQNIKNISGKIFNRWGQELFNFTNPTDSWDGKYKGNDVSEGVYFYVISVEYSDGSLVTKKGSVELIR